MALDKFAASLKKTRQAIASRLSGLRKGVATDYTLSPQFMEELEEALILADVGAESAARIVQELSADSSDMPAQKKIAQLISQRFESQTATNSGEAHKPCVILMVGVNGSGKTTTIAKIAHRATSSGGKVIVAAADTFRAAAGEQLEIWAKRAGAQLVNQKSGSDPAAVAFDAVKAALARKADMVLIDTAGRLQTKTNLMEELKKIKRVIAKALPGAPHEILIVMDATTGQNGLSQIKLFHDAIELSGIVVAKLDGTAKGGVLVAAAEKFKIPIKYVGVGEKIDDLVEFDPRAFAEALVGIDA